MNKCRVVLLLVVLLGTAVGGYAQGMTKDQKKISKCWKVFNGAKADSYEKGIEKLRKYMKKQPIPSLLAYESLVEMEYYDYLRNNEIVTNGLSAEVVGEELNDSLGQNLLKLLENYYFNYFVNVCRMSTIESTSPTADLYLRKFLVDQDPDTLISEKAKAYYDEAEEFFNKEDYELAELNYRKALKEDPDFYKACLYLGDTYWARENYDSALVYFAESAVMQPNLLEARVFLIDALVEKGLLYRAKKECVEALMVYPGYDLKYKLQRILRVENKFMNERRFIRYFYPNDMSNDEQGELTDPIWKDYRNAKNEASKYCDEFGIIEENGEIEDRYLEVYSMRRMLDKHPNDLPQHLHFADKMKEEGYLAPYVFISMFHVDIYPQFKAYMESEENREKCRSFIEKYLIEPIP